MFFNSHLINKTSQIVEGLKKQKLKIAFAESCSGGLLSGLFTEISGASDVFDRSFVTYSNKAKVEMLGVNEDVLAKFGAVSFEVAKAMAIGALKNSDADIAISITGIAGPNGGSKEKPVGLVYVGFARKGEATKVRKFNFAGDRSQVRVATLEAVLGLLDSAK